MSRIHRPSILLPYDKDGQILHRFINKHESYLRHKRGFYMLTFNIDDQEVIKIGIADGDLLTRLNHYKNHFGKQSRKYPCRGEFLHYLIVSNKNPFVSKTNSAVYRLEQWIIKELNAQKQKTDRGKEWFVTDRDRVNTLLQSKEMKEVEYHHKHNTRFNPHQSKKDKKLYTLENPPKKSEMY